MHPATHREDRCTDLSETARVLATVLFPTLARGVLLRRPRAMALLTRSNAERYMVDTLRDLRRRHGDDPLMLSVPMRRVALVLAPEDVDRILEGTPDPFSPAGAEKESALSPFQPHGVLISDHEARNSRRPANAEALRPGEPLHPDASFIAGEVDDEAHTLAVALERGNHLTWDRFSESFDALARRVVFGPGAAEDRRTNTLLRRLRARGNWSYLAPTDRATREEFLSRVRKNAQHSAPGSLASWLISTSGQDPRSRPEDQIGHWLFAFTAAAMATYRALYLMTALGTEARPVSEEARHAQGLDLPLTRATIQESVRLWPTTLVILRESTRETGWRDTTFPAGTVFAMMSSYLHRDRDRLPYADGFTPDIWLDGRAQAEPGLVPFSAGPAACAGRDMVLLTASLFLAGLLRRRGLTPIGAYGPRPGHDLPLSLNHFALRFSVFR